MALLWQLQWNKHAHLTWLGVTSSVREEVCLNCAAEKRGASVGLLKYSVIHVQRM